MYPYELPFRNTYTFSSLDELSYTARKMGLSIPVSHDLSPLARQPIIRTRAGEIRLKNSLTVHPMEGFDGGEDGSPSELSFRRYLRFARSGAALIWTEAIAVCPEGRTSDHQLMITEENKERFRELVTEVKKVTDSPIIAQLTHSGRFSHNSRTPYPIIATHNEIIEAKRTGDKTAPLVSDEYLDTLPALYAKTAELLVWAGFDGVDIKACHQYLLAEVLSAHTREGRYGGSFENRSRLLLDCARAVAAAVPDTTILGSRLGVYDALSYPWGFGAKTDGTDGPDFTEANAMIAELRKIGVSVVDMTMGTPYFNPHVNRPYNKGGYVADEHPLVGVNRLISGCREIVRANPDVAIIGTGYSYLREFAPYVAAGALDAGCATLIGFGRMAFAYEGFANDFIAGKIDPKKVCISCSKCTEIMRAGGTTGCPIRDQEIYLPIYRKLCMKK
ncbi:MAG: flavin oxidoreductase/NADH oxidase [Ruminococcus sp.]|nr:flavin oxidoreductase/NADH oxidase [Candidatus Apopatosoma intestinale]